MQTIFETVGGDEVQQRRRAAMYDAMQTSSYWLQLAERGFTFALRGHGNTPVVELGNVVSHLVQAAEYGAPVGDGVLAAQLSNRIAQETPAAAEIWSAIADALERVAVQRIAAHNEAAKIEAQTSMVVGTPV